MFISYSHDDKAWVWEELLPRLEGVGLRVCIDDRDFEIGVPIMANIQMAVDASQYTLVVLTPAWIDSEWTEFERLLAGKRDPAGRRRKLIPVLLKPCELPLNIDFLVYADLTQPDPYVDQLDRVVQQIKYGLMPVGPFAEDAPPFIAGPSITDPRHFFGHKRELKRLFGLWKHLPLQNAAIIGPRRSGKTSLLWYLKSIITVPPSQLRPGQRADWLQQPERYQWIFVDFQDPRMGSQEGLLRYLLDSLKLPAPKPCNLERCLDVLASHLRTPTIILLDEIGVALQRYPELDNSFWEALRSLATNQVGGNLAFVLTAHESPLQLAPESGHSSPFFNIFGCTATLGPLTEAEARELIASSPISFAADDVDWIMAQSGRWPLLLQILCRERLITLEDGETGDAWREEGLHQIAPFQYLLEIP